MTGLAKRARRALTFLRDTTTTAAACRFGDIRPCRPVGRKERRPPESAISAATQFARTGRGYARWRSDEGRMIMPISLERRVENYLRQTGRKEPTPRQRRRLDKKKATMRYRARTRP
jgi:hypothetical protein